MKNNEHVVQNKYRAGRRLNKNNLFVPALIFGEQAYVYEGVFLCMCIWVYVRLGCLYVREYVYAYVCLWVYLLAIRKLHFVYIPVR